MTAANPDWCFLRLLVFLFHESDQLLQRLHVVDPISFFGKGDRLFIRVVFSYSLIERVSNIQMALLLVVPC